MTTPLHLANIAAEAADQLLSFPWKLWFWGDSVGFEGLLDAADLTGQEKYLTFVYGVLKGWVAREFARSEFDYTAPGVALLRVYEKTGDQVLLDGALRHAEYMAAFRRTEAGAFIRYENAAIELPPELPDAHPESETAAAMAERVTDGGPCVFVDSVHFDGPFFAKLFEITGDERFRQLALDNICSQIELLFDPGQDLFHHFWMERVRRRNGVLWGRGNCWGLLGLVETLEHVTTAGPEAQRVLEVLRRTVRRMAGLQDPAGGWHTVLNKPDSYIESSISAFMVQVLSRSIEHGWIDGGLYYPVLESAMSFVLAHVQRGGLLEGVSYETFPSTRVEHYYSMPRDAMVPWGQGPLLSALHAYARWMRLQEFSGKMESKDGKR